MKRLLRICLLIAIGFISTCFGLSCIPCEDIVCKTPVCTTKIVKDECRCCDVCSKSIGERCGGPWNISGLCDNGLTCHKVVRLGERESNAGGTCEYGPPRVTCEFPKVYRSCATTCPKTCGNPYPLRCTENCNLDPCVCPEGYIMNNHFEQRCIRSYECEDFSFCRMDCTPSTIGTSSCDLPAKWVCDLTNWKCDAYKWKWISGGLEADVQLMTKVYGMCLIV
uniref:serine protease inhibitor swm-1-like n=1 Tax=Styela clava TaxID=7725 RepID=UPI00193AA866|nr:serine protease inhibitor swm-1-like [Styela clava]